MRPLCLRNAAGRVQAHACAWRLTSRRGFFPNRSRSLLSTATVEFDPSQPQPLRPNPQPVDAHLQDSHNAVLSPSPPSRPALRSNSLPVSCPGCGALSQDVDPGLAGYYTRSRKAVRNYLTGLKRTQESAKGDGERDRDAEESNITAREEGQDPDIHVYHHTVSEPEQPISRPVCDRCHYLIHDSRGVPIAHPSIEALADSIAESPFTRNHVYHVLDAADFPMSLVPTIYRHLSLARPRTQNRRSQHSSSSRPSLSFIITRSDLLAPTKEMVDSMMPKFISILRTALGRIGQKLRLGNVHLVSSKRGWWTKDVKEDIRGRGGGNWLVGKFNVGKSNLFEVIFPKGSRSPEPVYSELQQQQEIDASQTANTSFFSEKTLLPPSQPEVPFPTMPLVSSLPGTTASPIRLPFGNHKGELIDMPGLERGGLDKYVKAEDKANLVMVHRPTVSQHILKPGQSLLLGGGLVRITPILDENDRSTTMLAYPFVPLKAHVTSTEKAEMTQAQRRDSGIESILAEDTGILMSSAGRFKLQTDVTKSRAGSMIRAGANPENLPFIVYATDILIEGVGWVELVTQVRKSRSTSQVVDIPSEDSAPSDALDSLAPIADGLSIETNSFIPFGGEHVAPDPDPSTPFPEVEIFTPNGKFVGQRTSLGVWQMWASGKPMKGVRNARPRKPMSGAKQREKTGRRASVKAGR